MFIYDGQPAGKDGEAFQGIEINVNQYKQVGHKFISTSGTKYKAQQQYKGVDIFGATMVIAEDQNDNTKLSPISGTYYETDIISSDFDDDVTPLITEQTALQTAIKHYIPNGDETSLFGDDGGKVELTIYHNQEYGYNIPFTLSYIVQYPYQDTESQDVLTAFVVVDAKLGDVIHSFATMIGANTDTTQQRDCTDLDEAWANGGNEKIGPIRQGPMCIDARPDVSNARVRSYDYISAGQQNLAQCETTETSAFCEVQDYVINGGYNSLGDGFEYGNVVFDLYDAWGPPELGPLAPQHLPLRFVCCCI